jgi:hypothetical protein
MLEAADATQRRHLRHHGILAFSQRVNVPDGPSGPSIATRTTSREDIRATVQNRHFFMYL